MRRGRAREEAFDAGGGEEDDGGGEEGRRGAGQAGRAGEAAKEALCFGLPVEGKRGCQQMHAPTTMKPGLGLLGPAGSGWTRLGY